MNVTIYTKNSKAFLCFDFVGAAYCQFMDMLFESKFAKISFFNRTNCSFLVTGEVVLGFDGIELGLTRVKRFRILFILLFFALYYQVKPFIVNIKLFKYLSIIYFLLQTVYQ